MAMTDDSDFPRLMPPDDRYPAHDGLHRKPEELTDEQFDLLAAAWSEEALAGDQLSELEEAMTAIPSRRMRAESFRGVKLVPYEDIWAGRNRLLRQPPATRLIKRTLVVTLMAAAAVAALIITGPAIRSRTTEIQPGALREEAVMSEALIPGANPIIIQDPVNAYPSATRRGTETERPAPVRTAALIETGRSVAAGDIAGQGIAVSDDDMPDPGRSVSITEMANQARVLPVSLDINAVNPVMIAATDINTVISPEMNNAGPGQTSASATKQTGGKETNWIFRGISALAKAITKEEKNIDGYFIASACVNGINNVLGWEMQLEQASNKAGEPVAVNFSSSLLSISAPVNKNSP
jgi:hypothetical protein